MSDQVKDVPYPAHPERCQGIIRTNNGFEGQCTHYRIEGSNYCIIHGGSVAQTQTPLKELNLYRVKKYMKRISELKTANAARTIDEELAILRMVLEETLERTEKEGDMGLLLYSQKISEIIRDIKSCVITADKLATKAGTLLGRSEAIVIAGKVIEILSTEVNDTEVLSRIADKVADAFATRSEQE